MLCGVWCILYTVLYLGGGSALSGWACCVVYTVRCAIPSLCYTLAGGAHSQGGHAVWCILCTLCYTLAGGAHSQGGHAVCCIVYTVLCLGGGSALSGWACCMAYTVHRAIPWRGERTLRVGMLCAVCCTLCYTLAGGAHSQGGHAVWCILYTVLYLGGGSALSGWACCMLYSVHCAIPWRGERTLRVGMLYGVYCTPCYTLAAGAHSQGGHAVWCILYTVLYLGGGSALSGYGV
jgi:hypothetical protein